MTRVVLSSSLRSALQLDAGLSLAAGLLVLSLQVPLVTVIGLAQAWVVLLGLFMAGYGLGLALMGLASELPVVLVQTVVYGNGLWVVASFALLFSGWIAPLALGVLLIVAQALLVAVFAGLQYRGWQASVAA